MSSGPGGRKSGGKKKEEDGESKEDDTGSGNGDKKEPSIKSEKSNGDGKWRQIQILIFWIIIYLYI